MKKQEFQKYKRVLRYLLLCTVVDNQSVVDDYENAAAQKHVGRGDNWNVLNEMNAFERLEELSCRINVYIHEIRCKEIYCDTNN